MNQHPKKRRFLNKPYYPGGTEALGKFVQAHLQYPPEALEAKASGSVPVNLTIDHRGKVIEARAQEKLGYGLEEEAERVALLIRFEVAKNRNMRVTFNKTINIHFHLPPRPQANQKISYIYKDSPQPAETERPYTYTINL